MIPELHTSKYDGTSNTVIARLSDCIKCEVAENLNGKYELELQYSTQGLHAKELQTGRVILVQVDSRTSNIQPFRIYNVVSNAKGRITVNAQHISYDLNMMVVRPFSATGMANVLAAFPDRIRKASFDTLPWTFQSNITNTTSAIDLKHAKTVRSFLGGSEDSLLDVFGGEFEWDNFTVKLNSSRGEDRGVYIRYGVNLTALEKVEQYDKTFSHVVCYYFNEEDDAYVSSTMVEVSDLSQYQSDLAQSRIKLMDVTDRYKNAPTSTQLTTLARKYANKMSAGSNIGINVGFIDLRATNENVSGLSNTVYLGDTVHIVYSPLDISETKKIVGIRWNVLANRYDELVVGIPESTLAETISEF